jgi:hypothetical protein
MIKRAEIEMSNVQQKSASLLALSLFFCRSWNAACRSRQRLVYAVYNGSLE